MERFLEARKRLRWWPGCPPRTARSPPDRCWTCPAAGRPTDRTRTTAPRTVTRDQRVAHAEQFTTRCRLRLGPPPPGARSRSISQTRSIRSACVRAPRTRRRKRTRQQRVAAQDVQQQPAHLGEHDPSPDGHVPDSGRRRVYGSPSRTAGAVAAPSAPGPSAGGAAGVGSGRRPASTGASAADQAAAGSMAADPAAGSSA